jgi:hypothetical protein
MRRYLCSGEGINKGAFAPGGRCGLLRAFVPHNDKGLGASRCDEGLEGWRVAMGVWFVAAGAGRYGGLPLCFRSSILRSRHADA